jgi:hypothetical protein
MQSVTILCPLLSFHSHEKPQYLMKNKIITYEIHGLFFSASILLEIFQIRKKKLRWVTSQMNESL